MTTIEALPTLHAPPDPDLWADHIATVRAWEAETVEPTWGKVDEEGRPMWDAYTVEDDHDAR